MEEARIPREDIIDDPRLRTLVSMGSQDLTEAQRATLAKDKITVTHIVHDIPYADFYEFARRALKEMGVTLAK
jgi:hypothetical protein